MAGTIDTNVATFFTFGVMIGVLSCLGKLFRQKREIIILCKNCSGTNKHKRRKKELKVRSNIFYSILYLI